LSLKLSVLASGSSGNVIYIENDETSILIDAGLSKKRIEILLNKIGKDLSDIKAIFVSHEHIDHVRGIGVINRSHNTLIYGNKDTLSCDKFKKTTGIINPDSLNFIESNESIILDNLKITAFSTSHDSINSQFYMIEHKNKNHENKKLVCLTDIGYVDSKTLSIIKCADVYLIESNHNVDLLLNGNRPEFNKQRILSKVGHLSNEDCGNVLANCINENTHSIVLCHLSNDHNNKSLALESVKKILSENCSFFSNSINESNNSNRPNKSNKSDNSINIIAFTQNDNPTDIINV